MLDIDHFKRVNDQHGHETGDEAIRQVAALAGAQRALAGRLGGEEFAIILEGKTAAEAAELAEALRVQVAALKLNGPEGPFSITASFGVSEWAAGDSIDKLLHRADLALYAAKTNGRNRVIVHDAAAEGPDGAGGVTRAAGRTGQGISLTDALQEPKLVPASLFV